MFQLFKQGSSKNEKMKKKKEGGVLGNVDQQPEFTEIESPRDTQGGHENLQAGDSGEPKGIKEKDLDKIDIKPRQRTDQVDVKWR